MSALSSLPVMCVGEGEFFWTLFGMGGVEWSVGCCKMCKMWKDDVM